MSNKKRKRLATKLHHYFLYRIKCMGDTYDGCPECIEEALELGIRNFDGVIVFDGRVVGDWVNPEAFATWFQRPPMWEMPEFIDQLMRIQENVRKGRVNNKNIKDNKSEEIVMTSTQGNSFGKCTCYFDYLKNLQDGDYYVSSQ